MVFHLRIIPKSQNLLFRRPKWTTSISNAFNNTIHSSAPHLLDEMPNTRQWRRNRGTCLFMLKSCSAHQSTVDSVLCHVMKSGFQDDIVVATAFIVSFFRCGDVDGAQVLFDGMLDRDVVAWNAMLSGLERNGCLDRGLSLFRRMILSGATPNSRTLSILLQLGSEFDGRWLGRCVHAFACRRLGMGDVFLQNSLLVYYNQCGDVGIAETTFDIMQDRNIVSWNAMIAGYVVNGHACKALEVYDTLRNGGVILDVVTLETALQACAKIGSDAIMDGEAIHALLVRLGFLSSAYAGNTLLHMYCKCREMGPARCLFDAMVVRNVVSWNILIDGYSRANCFTEALLLFKCMHSADVELSSELMVTALQTTKLSGECLHLIMCIHCLVLTLGYDFDEFVNSSLISAYGEFGEVAVARKCFDNLLEKECDSRVCWNAMLSVYVHNGYSSEALQLLRYIQENGCSVDSIMLVNALSVCKQLLDLRSGKVVHGIIIRSQFESNVSITTSLLEFYSRCGYLNEACWLFSKMPSRNTITWNTMIFSCLQNGFSRVSLSLFHFMRSQHDIVMDAITIVRVIEAIAQREYESEGNYIYEYVIKEGFSNDQFVANSLIAMYVRFHDFGKASMVFDAVVKREAVTWNTMIAACSHHGSADKAISVFHLMKLNNVLPDAVTFVSVLAGCAHLASIGCAMWVHAIICKVGYGSDVFLGTTLIDTYAKCGGICMARLIFDRMDSKTTVSWNSMIHGYAMHGDMDEVNKLFLEMQQSNCCPSLITFLILISACSHSGNVQKGLHYFELMMCVYHLSPRTEHYSCFADLLSRRGLVREAYEFLQNLQVNPGRSAWGSLLGACRVQQNMEIGTLTAKSLFGSCQLDFEYYVLLSNMLSEAGCWNDACTIRAKLQEMGYMKAQGQSKIDN